MARQELLSLEVPCPQGQEEFTHVGHVDARLLAGALRPAARLEVRADALAGARRVLRELPRARVDDRLHRWKTSRLSHFLFNVPIFNYCKL